MINHLILLKIQNMIDIKGSLASMVYKFFHKKTSSTPAPSETLTTQNDFFDTGIKNKKMSDQRLAKELHKSIIK